MGCIEAITTFAARAGLQASTLLNARVHKFANLDDRHVLDTRPMPRLAGESQDRALRRKPAPHGHPQALRRYARGPLRELTRAWAPMTRFARRQALPRGHALPRPAPVRAHELGKARLVVAMLCLALTALAARAQSGPIVNSLGRPVPASHSAVINEFSPVLDKGSVLLIASDGDFDVESVRLAAFLTAEGADDAKIEQGLEILRRRMERDKNGFSFPLSIGPGIDTKAGNFCVLGVQLGAPNPVHQYLSSKKLEPILANARTPQLERVRENILAHEMFHCYQFLSRSPLARAEQIVARGLARAETDAEFAADAYMALRHLARYGEAETILLNAAYRDVALLNADWMHHTADMLRAAVSRYPPQRLRDMSIREVLQAAMGLRDEFAPTLTTIPEIQDSATTFSQVFLEHLRLNDDPAMQVLFGKVWESSVLIHGNLLPLRSMIGCGQSPELPYRKYCNEQLGRTRSNPIRTSRRQGGMQQALSIVAPRDQY